MKKKVMTVLLALFLTAVVLTGCSESSSGEEVEVTEENEDNADVEEAGTEAAQEGTDDLTEYAAAGVGTLYLPEGFEVDEEAEPGMENMTITAYYKGDIYIVLLRMDESVYSAAGVEMPTDLADLSSRAGIRQPLPDGTDFEEDSYGNLSAQYVYEEDGRQVYYTLLESEEAYGCLYIYYPEEELSAEEAALWASLAVVE
ncbi:MAG: hypothetical protein LIO86_02760 [Lachnospiraceae bacterium]|nr:hypothetical protein [Lachnospiraceae bacterium]